MPSDEPTRRRLMKPLQFAAVSLLLQIDFDLYGDQLQAAAFPILWTATFVLPALTLRCSWKGSDSTQHGSSMPWNLVTLLHIASTAV